MDPMTSRFPRLRFGALAPVLSLAVVLASCATGIGGDRESAMETIGDTNKKLVAMANEGAFDQAAVKEQATTIATQLDHFKGLFPAGSEEADKAAKPAIWTDRAGFEEARTDAYDAAVSLAAVTDAAGFATGLDTLQGSCKTCHRTYRANN